jgi:hypothetical protein
MLTWTQLRNRSSLLIRSLTALNRGQIEKLRPTFKPALKTHQSSSVVVALDKRQPKTGAARTPKLNSEDLLILILVYFAVYPTQDLLGLLLAGQQSWVCKWGHDLTPVLETTLAEEKQPPVRAGRPEKPIAVIFSAVVPAKSNRLDPWEYDQEPDQKRNEVEGLFSRRKGFDRIFSRLDQRDRMFSAFGFLMLILDSLRSC